MYWSRRGTPPICGRRTHDAIAWGGTRSRRGSGMTSRDCRMPLLRSWHHEGMERGLPRRHYPLPPWRPVPPLLSIAIALIAIVALPLCLPHGQAREFDADVRTITESRSVVEVVSTPGVHLLHHAQTAQIVGPCGECPRGLGISALADGAEASTPTEPANRADDLSPRVAVLPPPISLDRVAASDSLDPADAAWPEPSLPDPSPPPRRTG